MNATRRYAFNLPWTAAVAGSVFYAGLSFCMVRLARDYIGVIFAGFITLGIIFAAFAVFMIIRRVVFPRVLELTDEAIFFPHGFPRTRVTRIAYADIIRMSESGVGDQHALGMSMVTAKGSFEITDSYLQYRDSYKTVRDFICSKTAIVLTDFHKPEFPDWGIWGCPKAAVRWVEPETWPRYRTHLITSKPLLPRLAKALWFVVRCFTFISVPWLLLQLFQQPTISGVDFLYLASPVTFFFTMLHWLNAIWPVHPTEISFRERGITQFFGKQDRNWNYHDFSGWAVVERQFEGCVLHILLLKERRRVTAFALPDITARDRVVQICKDKQIPHSPDLNPPWESPSMARRDA